MSRSHHIQLPHAPQPLTHDLKTRRRPPLLDQLQHHLETRPRLLHRRLTHLDPEPHRFRLVEPALEDATALRVREDDLDTDPNKQPPALFPTRKHVVHRQQRIARRLEFEHVPKPTPSRRRRQRERAIRPRRGHRQRGRRVEALPLELARRRLHDVHPQRLFPRGGVVA